MQELLGENNVRIITNDEALENGLPTAKGFIKDGIIYLNISRFKNFGNAVSVGIHEMSHLIIASIKANTLKADEYYRLLNDLKQDPEYNELALLYPDSVGSDLDEEVLCCKIGKLLSNAINLNSDFETELLSSDSLLDGIKKLFNKVKSSKDIIGTSLNYAVLNYA